MLRVDQSTLSDLVFDLDEVISVSLNNIFSTLLSLDGSGQGSR